MRRRLLLVLLLTGAYSEGVSTADAPHDDKLTFFESKIRPVLVQHCYECHSGESKNIRAGLRLDSKEHIRTGGDSGPAVVPGNVEESLLIGALRHELWEMPPKGKLPDSVIADFERWIRDGAVDPRVGGKTPSRKAMDIAEARQFWSLQPLNKPAVPDVENANWPRNAIDRFILSRMEAKGLSPAAAANPATLLRRLTFDLIGLPPTVEEIQTFTADPSEEAYVRSIDRLLDSPKFGERWGRHWLDVSRFAESSGGGRSLLFPDAWRYRDYVIRAFNEDKPFNQFVTEHLAGDLLEPAQTEQGRRDQLTATGFLLLGPINYELQDKELLRMEVVDEQLDTVGRTFMGLTIGCARCHDHKFDPIPTRDYYALAGIFRSTKSLVPGNVSGFTTRELPVSPEHTQALAQYREKVDAIHSELDPIKKKLKSLQDRLKSSANLPGIVVDDREAILVGKWKSSTSVTTYIDEGYLVDDPSDLTEKFARFEVRLPADGEYEVRLAYTPSSNRASNTPVKIMHRDGDTSLTVNQRKPPALAGLFTTLGRFRFASDTKAVVELTVKGADGHVIVDAVQFLAVDAKTGELVEQKVREVANTPEIEKLTKLAAKYEKQLKNLAKSAPEPAPVAMCVREEEEVGDFHICIRGDVHNLGERVPRGFLQVVDVPTEPVTSDQSGRKALADWLTDPAHPLTTRVYCNRVWHWLLGTGLVRTPDNFGKMGETPSHPELLDWLAVTFQEKGWSTKALIREILLSRTYRLASNASELSRTLDPENRLLSHQNRRRLEAEEIRDAMLWISGRLDQSQGGPSFEPKAKEFGYEFTGTRRSVFLPVFRNQPHELFAVFDVADPNLVTGRRNVSTLATQALYLMNSPFVVEQAELAAASLLAGDGTANSDRIELAYLQTLGRPPKADERQLTLAFLKQFPDEAQAWPMIYQSLFGCIDFRYVE